MRKKFPARCGGSCRAMGESGTPMKLREAIKVALQRS
jgi:hypothetical protein